MTRINKNPSLFHILLVSIIFLIYSIYSFYPAVSNFGKVLIGQNDMSFFIWWFNHVEKSLASGKNPLFTNELFYPEGVWLTRSTMVPAETLIYLSMPQDWGVFGRITILQIIALSLGGVFSFIFLYRLTNNFLPSFIGSVFYDFSTYHLVKLIHHLNYGFAISLLPLFFIFYFELKQNRQNLNNLFLCALSLLLISLNEPTASIMVVFIVFLDILIIYWGISKNKIEPKQVIFFGFMLLFSGFICESITFFKLPIILSYILSQLVFLFLFFAFIFGLDKVISIESRKGLFFQLAAIFLPSLVYLSLLFLLPGYTFTADSYLFNSLAYGVKDLGLLILPPNTTLLNILPSYSVFSDSGMYITLGFSILFIYSIYRKKLHIDNTLKLALLCIVFAYPIIGLGDTPVLTTGMFSGYMFPLLNLLRVPTRFFIFALLFLSIKLAEIISDLLKSKKSLDLFLVVLCSLLIIFETIPNLQGYEFNSSIPDFYSHLNSVNNTSSLFFVTGMQYDLMVQETYAQSVHNHSISVAILSRYPTPDNQIAILRQQLNLSKENVSFIAKYFDYLVVYKKKVSPENSFLGKMSNLSKYESEQTNITIQSANNLYYRPIWEDENRMIYRLH